MTIISDIGMEPSKPSNKASSPTAEKRQTVQATQKQQQLKDELELSKKKAAVTALQVQMRTCMGISVYNKENPNEFPTCYGLRSTRLIPAGQFQLARPDVNAGVSRAGGKPVKVMSIGRTMSILDAESNLSFQSVGYVLMWDKVHKPQPSTTSLIAEQKSTAVSKPVAASSAASTTTNNTHTVSFPKNVEPVPRTVPEIASTNLASMPKVAGKMSVIAGRSFDNLTSPEFYERTSKKLNIASGKLKGVYEKTYEEYFGNPAQPSKRN